MTKESLIRILLDQEGSLRRELDRRLVDPDCTEAQRRLSLARWLVMDELLARLELRSEPCMGHPQEKGGRP